MESAARTHSYVASLPTQYIRFTTHFDPIIFMGQKIWVDGYGEYTILNLASTYGLHDETQMSGITANHQVITARSAASSAVPF